MTIRAYKRWQASCLAGALGWGVPNMAWSSVEGKQNPAAIVQQEIRFFSETFADLRIQRYQIPDFDKLSLQQKTLLYYLYEAALAGRDIMWDQNYRHNLTVRRTLEEIVKRFQGDRTTAEFSAFMTYVKRVWFSNGIHHHYSSDKLPTGFSEAYFRTLIAQSPSERYPIAAGETLAELIDRLIPILFDPSVDAKKVNLDPGQDIVKASAVNFYEGVTQAEAEAYYAAIRNPNDQEPISYGLNSKLVKVDGEVVERVYKLDGLYSAALERIIYWLSKATPFAESDLQRQTIEKLIAYYTTGDLHLFDEASIVWVADTEPVVDFVNGFIEVYNDPLGHKGSWESVVSVKDFDATAKFGVLSHEAAWFEEHSPIASAHKRARVTGVSYKTINVVVEAGDSSPASPIGINLPNSDWIRARHGSKSVSLGNIESVRTQADMDGGVVDEFYLAEAAGVIKEHGLLADKLTTGLHEVIGHASGRIMPGVGSPSETLKNYHNALEEGRADLVALYFIGDEHLVELGLVNSPGVMKAAFNEAMTTGLIKQLARIELGKDLEEAHMRNRQMIAQWAYERGRAGNVVELVNRDGKTFVVINDYAKLRTYFGELLREVQRIKSEGDYEAGKNLIENYGVRVDPLLHQEVKERWAALNVAPYAGFINPKLTPILDKEAGIADVAVSYPDSFTEQMLHYAAHHSFLPNQN